LTNLVLNAALDIAAENLDVRWQKGFREEDKPLQDDAEKTVALSAFMLTTLPTPIAQKALVEEMWGSGAHTIILIDHDTTEGFKAIAHAREHILELSRLETGDSEIHSSGPAGFHVLAPVSFGNESC
jgi:ribosomal protein RSM22 (predicted rRNA methylase)